VSPWPPTTPFFRVERIGLGAYYIVLPGWILLLFARFVGGVGYLAYYKADVLNKVSQRSLAIVQSIYGSKSNVFC
jgi:hypothetical protein